jgi:hypothetical protein
MGEIILYFALRSPGDFPQIVLDVGTSSRSQETSDRQTTIDWS